MMLLKQATYKLSRRSFLMRNLAISFIKYGSVKTTLSRAKALKIYLEPIVTKAKYYNHSEGAEKLHYYRLILSSLGNQAEIAKKLVDDIAPKYKTRQGGYLSLEKTSIRNDSAIIAKVSWLD